MQQICKSILLANRIYGLLKPAKRMDLIEFDINLFFIENLQLLSSTQFPCFVYYTVALISVLNLKVTKKKHFLWFLQKHKMQQICKSILLANRICVLLKPAKRMDIIEFDINFLVGKTLKTAEVASSSY